MRFFLQRNNKETLFKIDTGKREIQDLGQIVTVNGYSSNPAWRDDLPFGCNKIEGSDGQLRGPINEQESSIKIFVPEFDRPVQFDEVSCDKHVNNGQKVRRFLISENTFKSSENYKPNSCVHNYTWLSYEDYDGVFSKSKKTAKNQPIVFSKPNFLDADHSVTTEFFTALRPDAKEHDWFIEINEQTGETIYERRTMQVNVDTAPVNTQIARLFFPIYYVRDFAFATNQKYDK